jgi:hypothetical protein
VHETKANATMSKSTEKSRVSFIVILFHLLTARISKISRIGILQSFSVYALQDIEHNDIRTALDHQFPSNISFTPFNFYASIVMTQYFKVVK